LELEEIAEKKQAQDKQSFGALKATLDERVKSLDLLMNRKFKVCLTSTVSSCNHS